nr:hypothetical protein [Tanacetum cinerariifolium]
HGGSEAQNGLPDSILSIELSSISYLEPRVDKHNLLRGGISVSRISSLRPTGGGMYKGGDSGADELPLPPIDLPTVESSGYVAELNPKEDPKEYEDDETEDGPVDYPMDGRDDGDDDDGDSSGDDADDKDEDEDDEEEEEHLAPADFVIIIPTVEIVSPPEGTEPVIPPPSTDTTTTGAKITIWLQATISLLLEVGERLARCTTIITTYLTITTLY